MAGATYRPDEHWSFSVNARWQGDMWSTLSNNDTAHGVYGSFDRFFVVDTKIRYKYNDRMSFELRHRQYRQLQIFPVPSLPAADVRHLGEI